MAEQPTPQEEDETNTSETTDDRYARLIRQNQSAWGWSA